MKAIEYQAEILSDGHLSCPEELKKRLHLSSGSVVKVSISSLEQGRIIKLKGIWQGVEITFEDIESARKEMWGKLEAGS